LKTYISTHCYHPTIPVEIRLEWKCLSTLYTLTYKVKMAKKVL